MYGDSRIWHWAKFWLFCMSGNFLEKLHHHNMYVVYRYVIKYFNTHTMIHHCFQILIYMKVLILPFAAKEFCISGANILFKKKYSLLMTSALEHGDDMHLYYNMTSFTIKGRWEKNTHTLFYGWPVWIIVFNGRLITRQPPESVVKQAEEPVQTHIIG